MANEEEVLGSRKTMFVLVIVVGCFAVLWPRILSPLVLGHGRDQLKPNQFDRDAGCCEVLFETEVAVLEMLTEVCSIAVGVNGKLSPYAVAECRKTVNETCGLDIADFLKKTDNVGKTSKMLFDTMKRSNSSCLKEHFGMPVWSLSSHTAFNNWIINDTLKQERPIMRGAGPHPALRERGRAIPLGTAPPARAPVPLPPHIRVRPSPLSVYYELDIKPPPIPGMRPPLGSPGGPVQAPKSSMGFVMPIYTICIIVFFVYTLSKILFKRTGSVPYEQLSPDPQFRRRVFRDDSRSSPETKLVVTAISGLVAEVRQQMEASYEQNQQRQDVQDNNARLYTNGTIRKDEPIRIIASEYREKEPSPIIEETKEELILTQKEDEVETAVAELEKEELDSVVKDSITIPELKEIKKELSEEEEIEELLANAEDEDLEEENQFVKHEQNDGNAKKLSEDFIKEAIENRIEEDKKKTTPELLEEALEEKSEEEEIEVDEEDAVEPESTVKVLGMEMSAHAADGGAVPPPPPPPLPPYARHEAEDVKSIYLETEIPQQSKVIVTDFAEDRTSTPEPANASNAKKNAPLVVSGKMTLSLIQDTPRDTPDRDLESTVDDYTTASAMTHPVDAEKKGEESSEEELEEEEIEIEEIEEEEEGEGETN